MPNLALISEGGHTGLKNLQFHRNSGISRDFRRKVLTLYKNYKSRQNLKTDVHAPLKEILAIY